MNEVAVVFESFNPDSPNRGYWDQGLIEDIIAGRPAIPGRPHFKAYDTIGSVPADSAGVLLVSPAHFDDTHVPEIRSWLTALPKPVCWLLTSDEEGDAPWRACIEGIDGISVWRQSPAPDEIDDTTISIWPLGYPTGLRELAGDMVLRYPLAERRNVWLFAGQDNHERRTALVDRLRQRTDPGILVVTNRFAAGVSYGEYLRLMADTMVVPSPSGPLTPEAFRTYEAYEMGAVPIHDATSPRGDDGQRLADRIFEVPVWCPTEWDDVALDNIIDVVADGWPAVHHQVWARYQQWKVRLVRRLWASMPLAVAYPNDTPDDQITVLIPTSPIPSHPSLSVIEETVDSIRERLPTAPIVIMIDGVRDEQADRKPAYDEYVSRLLWATAHRWTNVTPWVADIHLHQAAMTRKVLDDPDLVTTPTILFVEHDTPLVGEIPFTKLVDAVNSHEANVIRFYPETTLQPLHDHLMRSHRHAAGVPLLDTVQWSQRPHIASSGFYRRILERYAGRESRTMIEDLVYGACENGEPAEWNVTIYTPEGDIKRSGHSDARGDDPKYDMWFQYDQKRPPPGAPWPTGERVD